MIFDQHSTVSRKVWLVVGLSCTCKISLEMSDFFINFWRTCPFCGATDTPVLDLWWRLPLVSKASVDFLACILRHLCTTDSSDSTLVRYLLTSLRFLNLFGIYWDLDTINRCLVPTSNFKFGIMIPHYVCNKT